MMKSVICIGICLVFSFVSMGCTQDKEQATGSAIVAIKSSALSKNDIDEIILTISGSGIDGDIVVPLSGNPTDGWSETIDGIPIGNNRTFDARAYDSMGIEIYSGATDNIVISTGQVSQVNIFLWQVEDPVPFENAVPRFNAIVLSASQVSPETVVNISASATDPDGDDLVYSWTSEDGNFNLTDVSSVNWTAPSAEGIYALTVSVTDPQNATATVSFTIEVGENFGTGSAEVIIELNTRPEILNLIPSKSRIDVDETTDIDLTAFDGDDDTLEYSWSANCTGNFNDSSLEDPSFTLDADNDGEDCTLSVTITDSHGETNNGSIALATGPEVFPTTDTEEDTDTETDTDSNQPPIADAGEDLLGFEIGVPITVNGSGSYDPDGDDITFQWSIDYQPEGSSIVLSDSTSVTPSFIPDMNGIYIFSLIVNDGELDSAVDTVMVSSEYPIELTREGFEEGWGDWYADNGIWEVGEPSYGCEQAHTGTYVAGTVLNGIYSGNSSRLISPAWVLPARGTNEELQLRFWQWFDLGSIDVAHVQVSLEVSPGSWSDWNTLAEYTDDGGSVWSTTTVDLSAYAGNRVRVGFIIEDDTADYNGAGWYIDDVSLLVVPVITLGQGDTLIEDFENGPGNWYASNGAWENGAPISPPGPSNAHSGDNVFGTVLDDIYSYGTSLVSPSIQLPIVTSGEEILLRFAQWFSFGSLDSGNVQISSQTEPGVWSEWIQMTQYTGSGGGVWSSSLVDITDFSGQKVKIGFSLQNSTSDYNGAGWYIDDVEIQIN